MLIGGVVSVQGHEGGARHNGGLQVDGRNWRLLLLVLVVLVLVLVILH